MEAYIKANTEQILAKFREIDYSELNGIFRKAISDALQILKKQTEANLAGTGININAPVVTSRKGVKSTFSPLSKGVIAEVSNDGTAGRVRIAKAKKDSNWPNPFGDDFFALKWFELGTDERHKKGGGYSTKANSNKKQGGTRKHRNKGASTGRIKAYNFFGGAFESTRNQVEQQLNDNITKAIEQIYNR